MPADTFNEMVLGFAVILGILLIYVLTLIWRFWRLRRLQYRNRTTPENPSSDPLD